MASQLTHKEVINLNTPGRYFIAGTGLHVLVKPSKKKYWIFRFTLGGKRHDYGLGSFPRLGLADARKAAMEARILGDSGINPVHKRQSDRKCEEVLTAFNFRIKSASSIRGTQ